MTTAFDEFSKAYQKAAVAEVQAMKEMEEAKEILEVAGYQVEMAVIVNAGDEKKVGSTEAARSRAYALAKNETVAYKEAREFYLSTKQDYRYHKHLLRLLDLRGQFIVGSIK